MESVRKFAVWLLGVSFVLAAPVAAQATQPDPEHKVGICHRTASDTNPYVFIEVDEASLDAHLNNLPGHPAKTNEDGSPRNDYLAESAEDCVTATPTPTPTPTPTETPSPTPTESTPPPSHTWSATWSPTWTPSQGTDIPRTADTGLNTKALAEMLTLGVAGFGFLLWARKTGKGW